MAKEKQTRAKGDPQRDVKTRGSHKVKAEILWRRKPGQGRSEAAPCRHPFWEDRLPQALRRAPAGLLQSLHTINKMWHTHILGHSPANVCEPYSKLWTVADVSVLGCNSLVSHCTYLPGMGCRGQRGDSGCG